MLNNITVLQRQKMSISYDADIKLVNVSCTKQDFIFLRWSEYQTCQEKTCFIAYANTICPGSEVIKLFSCSPQMSMKFILLINVKMPTILPIFIFMSSLNFILRRAEHETFYNLEPKMCRLISTFVICSLDRIKALVCIPVISKL